MMIRLRVALKPGYAYATAHETFRFAHMEPHDAGQCIHVHPHLELETYASRYTFSERS
jgi:hypothetical protein